MCDFEKIPSGYGLGISFPVNEYTRAFFGNPERFTKYRDSSGSGKSEQFPGFEVRFSGAMFMAGTLEINGYSPPKGSGGKGKYEGTLIDQVGVLSEKEAERNILEIPAFETVEEFQNKATYDPDEDHYCCFPVRNTGFFKDRGYMIKKWRMVPDPADATKLIKEDYDIELLAHLFQSYPSTFSQVNALNTDGTVKMPNQTIDIRKVDSEGYSDASGYVQVVTPFFFLNYIVDVVLKDSGLFLTDANYLKTHAALKNLVIYNNFDITSQTFSLFPPGSPNDHAYIASWPDEGGIRSMGEGIAYYNRSYDSLGVKINRHLPKMQVGDLLMSIQNLFNVCFNFKPNGTVDVLSREAVLASDAMDLDQYFIGEWEMPGKEKRVALKFKREHDDNDLIFSERFTDLSDRKKNIKTGIRIYGWDELPTKIPFPEIGEIRYIEGEDKYAEYKWLSQSADDPISKTSQTYDVLGWDEVSIGFQDGWYKYGREDVEQIKTSWTTTIKSSSYDDTYGWRVWPEVNQQGNMATWPAKKIEFKPRLLFYQPYAGKNRGFNTYTFSSTSYLSMEYEPTGDSWESTILATFWKYWLPFWANRLPVAGEFDLPVNVLRHIIYNICQKYRTREGEFLIDEMSCEIFVNRIGTVDVKGFKV